MALLSEGQVIRGTYEVERYLGEGAFAEVYRVKHRFLGRQAIKIFKLVGLTTEEVEQMLGEAILLSRIGHPNIVRVFDANTTETSQGVRGFFTMEYVAGGSLDQFWRSHGMKLVPVATAVDILRQVCRGLSVAHEERPPVIHRDIKPQNILVGYDGAGLRIRVSDFGLAKRVNPLTLMASARGTLSFKSPEAFRDPRTDSCAGDVWALGTTLYLLLTDRLPYGDGSEVADFSERHFKRPLIPCSHLNIEVDPALDQILFRALSLDPKDRHQNAKELLADLMDWKPRPAGSAPAAKTTGSAVYKSALGVHSPEDAERARRMASLAIELARQANKLQDAADLMEEACNKMPSLGEQYGYLLRLWRRGIVS